MTEILLYIAIALQVADAVTTYLVLRVPGGYEKNELMRTLFQKIGLIPGLILMKLVFICLLLIVFLYVGTFASIVLAFLVGFYVKLLLGNLSALNVRWTF